MFCNKCGSKIEDGEKFCGECGNSVAQMIPQTQASAPAADATVMAQASAPAADATVMAQPQAPVQPQMVAQPQVAAQTQAPVQPQVAAQPQAPQMQGQSLMQTNTPTQTYAGQPGAVQQNGKQEPALKTKKKKPWVVFIVIGAVVLVLGGIVAGLFAFGAVDKINSRIKASTADKYFANMDYENAIAYYTQAIEIDPTNVDAYLGLADVYVALADYDSAIDVLLAGVDATGSNAIEERLDEVYEINRYIYGYVYKVDTDTDPKNNEPLVGATVEITFPNGDVNTYTADANGYYETEKELASGKYEVYYYYNDEYIDYSTTIKADEGKVEKNVYLEPLIYAQFYGTILIGDDDTNYSNNEPLEGAEVKIQKINASNEYNNQTTTDYDGGYSFSGLLMGVYKLTIHKDGFIDVVQNITIYEGQTESYNASIELLPEEYGGEGHAEGTIYDAVDGHGVEGLTLYIREGINNTEGATVGKTTTDLDGIYRTPSLKSGNYCIEVVDERDVEDAYIDTMINVKILGGITITNQDATVSSVLLAGQIRIVLTWGSYPDDLDSHLFIGLGDTEGHLYYEDYIIYYKDTEIADLDLDDTDCYGPETTTIYNPMNGGYLFAVHNYSDYYDTDLMESGATVMVYTEGATAPSYVFYVPYGYGDLWVVFSYDAATGQITPINEISNDFDYEYDPDTNSWVKY